MTVDLPASALVVASKFAPHAGGTAVVWTHWCQHWPAERLRVIAPRIPHCGPFDREQAYQILRCGYPDIPKIRMPWLWFHQATRLLVEVRRAKPDFIHLSHVFENGFMGPFLKRMSGIPYFVHTYGEELEFARRFPWLRRLVGTVLREASGVTTISRYTESLHSSFGFQEPALLVHPGVDVHRFRPGTCPGLREKLGLPPGPMLLTTGRLMERKGHDWVIRALPELLASFSDLSYVVAGVGPYEAQLRSQVDQLGLGQRVHFLGRVADEDLSGLMQEATVFVHPNRVTREGDVEGFGIVFLEAAACGLPVVGGASGGVPDAVQDGKNGVLVEDEPELRAQLHRLLLDSSLRNEMSRAGIEWAKLFSWQSAARRVWEYSASRVELDRLSAGTRSPSNATSR